MSFVKLNNGILMPNVGLGTFLLEPSDAENSVREALKVGYRLIDTANAYMNEKAVGRGMRASGVERKDIFLSTKLWPNEYENPSAVEQTLERLGTDYVDLLFVHQPAGNWRAGYEQVVKAYEEGKTKSIGISNFEGEYIATILKEYDVKPQVIQVECHPFFPQVELRKVTDKEDIRIMSWFPLGGKGRTAELLDNPIVVDLARKHGKTPAQIVMKWHTQMGFIVIPGSKNAQHIKENIDIFDFELDDKDMQEMAKLNVGQRHHIQTKESLIRYATWCPTYEN